MMDHVWSIGYMICYICMKVHVKLINVVLMFILVILRWCLSVDGAMQHYSCITPSITCELRRGSRIKGKEDNVMKMIDVL